MAPSPRLSRAVPPGSHARNDRTLSAFGDRRFFVPATQLGLGIGPPPCPLSVPIDLQDRVVLLSGSVIFSQVDSSDRILRQPPERLRDVARSERGLDAVQQS